jgi:putative hydroxymethylpyrimidine transport system ATP-binding protein
MKKHHTARPVGIDISACSLAFAHHVIFSDFHLEIKASQWVCILGSSGVGKTSLLKLILALLPLRQGKIEASDGKPLKNRIAYMAQQDLLMPWLSILDNALLGYRLRGQGVKRSSMINQAEQLFTQVGLPHVLSLKPADLSAGMRQRVALVRTLMEDRPIVLMDEPFSALDMVTRFKMHELTSELLKEKTVLFITHDPLEAIRLADVIYVMHGTPAKLSEPIVPEGKRVRDLSNEKTLNLYSTLFQLLSSE